MNSFSTRGLMTPQEPSQAPSQEPSDDEDFNVVGGEILATFSPWASWLSTGDPFAPVPPPLLRGVAGESTDGQTDPGSVVAVSSGGITFNLIFDTAAQAAPASFRAGIQQAVAILASVITDKITVNIKIDYSGTGGGAAAGPDHGVVENYSLIRTNLINGAVPGDTTFNALPSGTSIQGQSTVAVWNAQLKLWGLLGANDTTTDDGAARFATDINPNLLVGVALHELTHAMGRVPYGSQPDIFDLFRFTTPGTRLFQGGATAPAAYFSIDGGNTKLADYGRTSDASDFLNSGVQGSTDPFNEFYNGATTQGLTAADLKQLVALGFHLAPQDTQTPNLANDGPLSIEAGTSRTLTASLLIANDNVSSGAQLRYTITTAPGHGALLLNGAVASSFTQADINNGLVSYWETVNGVSSDAFSFKIADAAGNTTAAFSFQINVTPFDALEYLASNSDLIAAFGLNLAAAAQHYFPTGINEHRSINSFDASEYLASYPDLIQAFGLNLVAAEQHYVTNGFNEHRATASFDASEYLASNPDLIQAFGLNPLAAEQHYVTNGFNEHRATHSFDAVEYLASNPDLIQAFGLNPLAAEKHYVTNGFNEHRATTSFDAVEYLASNPDLIQAFGLNPLAAEKHYITNGFNEHRATHSFDAFEYLASNPDLIQAFGLNPVAAEQHYVVNGFNEHRQTTSFNVAQYVANYPDLIAAFGNNLNAAEQHFITNGYSEGRTDQKPVINGDGGNNILVAKNGAIMTGGAGADTFVFNSSLLTPATVNDFAVGTDHLQISAVGFGHGLTAGGTAPLVTAATAASATHVGSDGYFIFDNTSTVWWDPNGGSGADAVALAKLAGIGALHASDFLLV
jgi:Cadherin-like